VFATDDIFDLKSEVSVFFSYEAVLTNEIGAARNKLPRFGTDAVTHSARSHARGLLPNASNAQAASATRSCAVSDGRQEMTSFGVVPAAMKSTISSYALI